MAVLDPYVDKIMEVLVPHYSTCALIPPGQQQELIETLERCIIRVALQGQDIDSVKALDAWRKRLAAHSDGYSRVVLHQMKTALHDQARIHVIFRLVDRLLDHYSSTGNFTIPISLVGTLALAMKHGQWTLREARGSNPDFSFVWPKIERVIEFLDQAYPDHNVSPEFIEQMYQLRPLKPLPQTLKQLDSHLLNLCRRGDGLEFALTWRRYRDLYDDPEPYNSKDSEILSPDNRQATLTTFYYRMAQRLAEGQTWYAADVDGSLGWEPTSVNNLMKEIFERIPKPYTLQVLHGMLYVQTRPGSSSRGFHPDAIMTSEAEDDKKFEDPNEGIDVQPRAGALNSIWKIAHEPCHKRDVTFYGLYITALGYCNQPALVREAWHACIEDKRCSQEYLEAQKGQCGKCLLDPQSLTFAQILTGRQRPSSIKFSLPYFVRQRKVRTGH